MSDLARYLLIYGFIAVATTGLAIFAVYYMPNPDADPGYEHVPPAGAQTPDDAATEPG